MAFECCRHLVVCLCIIDTNCASAYIQRSNQSKSHKFFIRSVAIMATIVCKLPVVHAVCRIPGCIIELINASLGGGERSEKQ